MLKYYQMNRKKIFAPKMMGASPRRSGVDVLRPIYPNEEWKEVRVQPSAQTSKSPPLRRRGAAPAPNVGGRQTTTPLQVTGNLSSATGSFDSATGIAAVYSPTYRCR